MQVNKLDKMKKINVFVSNRLHKIQKLCENDPIVFSFVDGFENPADFITRPISPKLLKKSNYISGPKFITDPSLLCSEDLLTITVPNPKFQTEQPDNYKTELNAVAAVSEVSRGTLAMESHVPYDRFSSLRKLVGAYRTVFKFIKICKNKLARKINSKYAHLAEEYNPQEKALNFLLRAEQRSNFPEVFNYFYMDIHTAKEMPNIVQQLNLYIDKKGLLRVGSKFLRKSGVDVRYCPILLPKNSTLTNLIISSYHTGMCHSGIYGTLNQMRKKYWLSNCFSQVKKVLSACVHCKRMNGRTVKLNQGMYRDFRLDPPNIPFSTIAIDYAGPYSVQMGTEKTKVYVLVITCLFSRAVNLKVSINLTVEEFLRSFQLHCHEHGLPSYVLSDLGSQIVAGADIIKNFLNDPSTVLYFQESGAKMITFEQYYKGRHQLGSLVETCVKAVKRLIYGAIGRSVLCLRDFEFFVSQTIHLVNRRAIAFSSSLRDCKSDVLPQPITPELLLRGFDLTSVNIVPALHTVDYEDTDDSYSPVSRVQNAYEKLRRVRSNLFKIYRDEFLPQLISQATDQKSRYQPKSHDKLAVGDLVLLKEENTKPTNMPMGRVLSVTENELGEVTGAIVLKGSTRERVKRHASALVPLLRDQDIEVQSNKEPDTPVINPGCRPKRSAAVRSRNLTRDMLQPCT